MVSKDGHITGTYGKGELQPQEHITANLMEINVSELDRGTTLTPLQAHSRYLPILNAGARLIAINQPHVPAKNQENSVQGTIIRVMLYVYGVSK